MKVSGFSFVRNAIIYDYPVVEAIQSILPLCDDVYIAVGRSEDETLDLVRSIDSGIHIIETDWDDSLKKGEVLAKETNKALKAIPESSDWCFYIQADEVIHEQYYSAIRQGMIKYLEDLKVDGLLFNYRHFFGSYDYYASAPNWYRKEIRILRNDPSIYSYRDAQGFRKEVNRKLRVKPIDAYVFHYGWVKHPEVQLKKHKAFHKLYHEREWADPRMYNADEFDYSIIDALDKFEGTHPKVMKDRISRKNWEFDRDLSFNRMNFKNRIKYFFEKHLGYIPGEYKNYRII